MKRVWVTVGILSLQANLSLAGSLPDAVTHSDFFPVDEGWARIGRDLFFDPLLSGNLNIACATCHHPSMASTDTMSLSLGEGGVGLGVDRKPGSRNAPIARIPRNAPALFNLGAFEFTNLLHDGRLQTEPDAPFGIRMPGARALQRPVPSVLSAQGLLPMSSADEMAGHPGENAIADAVAQDNFFGSGGAWYIITARVAGNPTYAERFQPLVGERPLDITDIGRALGEFMNFEFRAIDSPFDRYLAGDTAALTEAQARGMDLFYGAAQCDSCHSGPLQTDHGFHAIGMPQFGPGKIAETQADTGRGAITGQEEDNYRFRTPSLRNVAMTAPYGHDGAFATLEGVVRHHLSPMDSLTSYDRTQAQLHAAPMSETDWRVMDDDDEVMRIAMSVEIAPVSLTEPQISDLLEFLGALSDPSSVEGRLGAPDSLPSGLPLDR